MVIQDHHPGYRKDHQTHIPSPPFAKLCFAPEVKLRERKYRVSFGAFGNHPLSSVSGLVTKGTFGDPP